MSSQSKTSQSDILQQLIDLAKRHGADAADAMVVDGTNISVGWRLGKIESLEQASSGDIGLRVFVGKKQAVVSSTDRNADNLAGLAERAVAMARLAPEDQYCGLSDPSQLAVSAVLREMADDASPTAEELIATVKEAEDAARAVKGVTNSEGAEAGASRTHVALAASNGFWGQYTRTGYSLSASVIAGEGVDMQRDYDFATRVFYADMPPAAHIGREAAERTVRRLNPRKVPTTDVPVVFDPRIAGGLLGQLAGAISGSAIARGTSFLKDKMGEVIFSPDVNVVDDPFRARGLRTRPFDAEGIAPTCRKVIDNGRLTTWLLDNRSARQLGLSSTGHAVRSPGGVPSPSASNLYMGAGKETPEQLMAPIKSGFYVTELMGMGVNGVTGDYSQAASGFWIENGVLAYPVSEVTIASNLKDMYRTLTPANDLQFLRGVDSPTLRIERMTVAGL